MLRRQANSVLREEWVWGEGEFYNVVKKKKNEEEEEEKNPTWYTLKHWRPDTHAQMHKLNCVVLTSEGLTHMHAQLEQV